MIKLLTVLILLTGSILQAEESKILHVNSERLIRVHGEVNGEIIRQAENLTDLANKSLEPIYIHLNSPGGSVLTGNIFINAMQNAQGRGIKLICVVPAMAASMAFNMLAQCDERNVFPTTQLLFHAARVSISNDIITAQKAKKILDQLTMINEQIAETLIESMDMDSDIFMQAFDNDYWWSGSTLDKHIVKGWLNIISGIEGMKGLFQHPGKPYREPRDENKRLKIVNQIDVVNKCFVTKPKNGVVVNPHIILAITSLYVTTVEGVIFFRHLETGELMNTETRGRGSLDDLHTFMIKIQCPKEIKEFFNNLKKRGGE